MKKRGARAPTSPAVEDDPVSMSSDRDLRVVEQLAVSALDEPDKLPVLNLAVEDHSRHRLSSFSWEIWVIASVLIAVVANGVFRWTQFAGFLD